MLGAGGSLSVLGKPPARPPPSLPLEPEASPQAGDGEAGGLVKEDAAHFYNGCCSQSLNTMEQCLWRQHGWVLRVSAK